MVIFLSCILITSCDTTEPINRGPTQIGIFSETATPTISETLPPAITQTVDVQATELPIDSQARATADDVIKEGLSYAATWHTVCPNSFPLSRLEVGQEVIYKTASLNAGNMALPSEPGKGNDIFLWKSEFAATIIDGPACINNRVWWKFQPLDASASDAPGWAYEFNLSNNSKNCDSSFTPVGTLVSMDCKNLIPFLFKSDTQMQSESRIRYILVDSQLGDVIDYYRNFISDPIVEDAIKRWDAGVRVENIWSFERKVVNGSWMVVYEGTDQQIDGLDVILTK